MWMTDKAFPWNPFITLRQKFLGASRSLSWLKLQMSNLNSHLHFVIVFFFGCYGRQGHRWHQSSCGLQSNLNLFLCSSVSKAFDKRLFRASRKLGERNAMTPAKKNQFKSALMKWGGVQQVTENTIFYFFPAFWQPVGSFTTSPELFNILT